MTVIVKLLEHSSVCWSEYLTSKKLSSKFEAATFSLVMVKDTLQIMVPLSIVSLYGKVERREGIKLKLPC